MGKTIKKKHDFGFIEDDKVFLKGFLEFPDRQIGVVKETEEAAIKYFENRFAQAQQKVNDLEKLIEEAQNKGSYLMKLIHMRKYLSKFDGLGDYVMLFNKLDELELGLKDLISVNRVKNLEIKQALLKELEDFLVNIEDWKEATDQLQELKMKWIKTGSVDKENHDPVEDKFNTLLQSFFDRRKEHFKNRSNSSKNKINAYKNIIYQVERLKYSDEFEATFQEFRNFQQAWKTIGKIPHSKAIEFWDKFKKANDFFFTRFKLYKALKEEYPPELTAGQIRDKLASYLCQEAIKNAKSEDENATDRTKDLLVDWKKLTSIYKAIPKDIAEVFRYACDRVFEMNYLIRVIKRKYPLFDSKLLEEKLRIQISFMRELIKKDEFELQNTERDVKQKTTGNAYEDRALMNGLLIQQRKIEVKKQILNELQEELNKK